MVPTNRSESVSSLGADLKNRSSTPLGNTPSLVSTPVDFRARASSSVVARHAEKHLHTPVSKEGTLSSSTMETSRSGSEPYFSICFMYRVMESVASKIFGTGRPLRADAILFRSTCRISQLCCWTNRRAFSVNAGDLQYATRRGVLVGRLIAHWA